MSFLQRLNAATRQRHRQVRADDLAWRDELAAKLDALADGQAQLRAAISQQADAAQPSRLAMRRGRLLLAITGLFVVLFVGLTVLASSTSSRAMTLEEQAQADYLGSYQVLLPDVEVAAEHGVQYLVNHANDVSVEAIQSSSTSFTQARNEEAAANRLDNVANISQLVAQIGLTASAALFGAVAGWMLIPVLSRPRPSQVRQRGNEG